MENMSDNEQEVNLAEPRVEYDFSKGIRGKHSRTMQGGYVITITEPDGTTTIKEVSPKEGVVVLEPDVLEYFPDSQTVNETLRSLIKLIPSKPSSQPSKPRH